MGELKHEIGGKTLSVAANLLVEALGGYSVEGGKFGIEQHTMV